MVEQWILDNVKADRCEWPKNINECAKFLGMGQTRQKTRRGAPSLILNGSGGNHTINYLHSY